ncbi:MAG: epoxide hydrolase, partial [Planctomycetes bacterium]|nr:epoxide hydrolase [Planctomycetota bacterium]
MIPISPFRIEVPQDTLDDLRDRLRRTRWPDQVPGTGWSRGVDLDYLKDLVRYWAEEFDWRKQEERLNRLPHFLADVEGLRLHFIHQPGKGPAPLPLFMMHGYPWSFVLLERILPMLTDPA